MSSPTFDLQSHSVHSDGALAPRDVVAAAAAAGVELLALSDHDSVHGLHEAIAAGAEHGVRIAPAVEISAVEGDKQDLHVLGYGIDPDSEPLRDALERYREDREQRADKMVETLKELGYAIDDESLAKRKAQGKTVGRPHIADAAVNHPANRERLQREGLAERTPFLVAYLIEGKPAFAPRTHPTVPEAIDVIKQAGGVAIWAHPFWDVKDPGEVLEAIDRFAGHGLDGVEVFYVTHTREEIELLADRCAERDMLSTGSSDFHGPDHRLFSRFRAFETYGREPRLGPIAEF